MHMKREPSTAKTKTYYLLLCHVQPRITQEIDQCTVCAAAPSVLLLLCSVLVVLAVVLLLVLLLLLLLLLLRFVLAVLETATAALRGLKQAHVSFTSAATCSTIPCSSANY
jgi:hypothetical protein